MLTPLLLLLACGGPSTPPVEKKAAPQGDPAAAAPATTAAAKADQVVRATPDARKAPAGPPDDPTLADQYLVIIASKLDPAEVEPAIAAVRAHPELGANPRTLRSSGFKNLMPCYTTAIADAFADKKAAVALSKKLTAAGIDNYPKNAGAYLGQSPAIDAYCASWTSDDSKTGDVRVVAVRGGQAFLPADGGADALTGELPAAEPVGEGYDTWTAALPVTQAGTTQKGQRWQLIEAATGTTQTCSVSGFTALTLGTPHFGVLQAEDKPTEPTCGAAEVYATLDCAGLADGFWVAVPADRPAPQVWKRGADETTAHQAEASAALARVPDYQSPSPTDMGEGTPTTSVVVTRYDGPSGALRVVEGTVSYDGACGGDQTTFTQIYAVEGEGLGRPLGAWQQASFSQLDGLVDVDGDQVPELMMTRFPTITTVNDLQGNERANQTVAYCDCPC